MTGRAAKMAHWLWSLVRRMVFRTTLRSCGDLCWSANKRYLRAENGEGDQQSEPDDFCSTEAHCNF